MDFRMERNRKGSWTSMGPENSSSQVTSIIEDGSTVQITDLECNNSILNGLWGEAVLLQEDGVWVVSVSQSENENISLDAMKALQELGHPDEPGSYFVRISEKNLKLANQTSDGSSCFTNDDDKSSCSSAYYQTMHLSNVPYERSSTNGMSHGTGGSALEQHHQFSDIGPPPPPMHERLGRRRPGDAHSASKVALPCGHMTLKKAAVNNHFFRSGSMSTTSSAASTSGVQCCLPPRYGENSVKSNNSPSIGKLTSRRGGLGNVAPARQLTTDDIAQDIEVEVSPQEKHLRERVLRRRVLGQNHNLSESARERRRLDSNHLGESERKNNDKGKGTNHEKKPMAYPKNSSKTVAKLHVTGNRGCHENLAHNGIAPPLDNQHFGRSDLGKFLHHSRVGGLKDAAVNLADLQRCSSAMKTALDNLEQEQKQKAQIPFQVGQEAVIDFSGYLAQHSTMSPTKRRTLQSLSGRKVSIFSSAEQQGFWWIISKDADNPNLGNDPWPESFLRRVGQAVPVQDTQRIESRSTCCSKPQYSPVLKGFASKVSHLSRFHTTESS